MPSTAITGVRWGIHVDRAAPAVWLSHPALDIHPDLSRKACVCRAGLGCTKLNSLLNFLVGSSQQQLLSVLKKFIFEIQVYTVECSTCFLNQCFPPPSLWRSGLRFFQRCLRLRVQPPLSEIPDFNWLWFLQCNHSVLLALFLILIFGLDQFMIKWEVLLQKWRYKQRFEVKDT